MPDEDLYVVREIRRLKEYRRKERIFKKVFKKLKKEKKDSVKTNSPSTSLLSSTPKEGIQPPYGGEIGIPHLDIVPISPEPFEGIRDDTYTPDLSDILRENGIVNTNWDNYPAVALPGLDNDVGPF